MGTRIEIESNGNAAFEGDERPELARILRQLADELEKGRADHPRKIYDVNGNQCGNLSMSEDWP